MYSKKELRKNMLKKRKSLSKKEIEEMSLIITNKLRVLLNDEKIGLFYPIKNEVDLLDLLDLDVSFPRIVNDMKFHKYTDEFKLGKFDIPEPTGEVTEIDTVIVPGSVFDYNGYRIGYGGGYYDRYLKPEHLKIGVCFEFQLMDHLPIEDYDVRLDMLVTEKNIYRW